MKAKKSLGQNFLTSEKALLSIIRAANIQKEEQVLEIGPGKGALTEKLLDQGARVVAIEKDDELHGLLKSKFKEEISNGRLDLIHGDALEFDLSTLGDYKVVANIPYNITGLIIRKLLSAQNSPKKAVLLLQKEVVERIVAKNKKESILSISVKAYGDPSYVEKVKAGSFSPVPKVDSAILTIDHINKEYFTSYSEEDFFNMVHAGFSSKRKKLISNLNKVVGKEKLVEVFKKLDLDENTRAEDVSITTWKKLMVEVTRTQRYPN